MPEDERFMQAALALARRNLGQTWPNPAVGALVVKSDQIISQGWTGRGGRPHAETIALKAAGKRAKGATLYVTLEPCAHHGKTPPCVEAVIKAGIGRCVIACRDQHPGHGGGVGKLKAAGIEVVENVCEEEARDLNAGFFSVVERGRPFVALKIATSADEKIARHAVARRREGGWITGEEARAYGHLLRSRYDAIVTGIGTVLADDPLLTCRLPGLEDRSPVRVVLDRRHRLPNDCQIAKTKDKITTWMLDAPDIASALQDLAGRGITRLLVEAGQGITTGFLASGCVDKIYWFKSQSVIGEGGLPALAQGKSLSSMLASRGFIREDRRFVGSDSLEIYVHRHY